MASQQDMFDDALAQQRRGNHKGAVKRFKRVLKQSPDHPQILNLCARSLAELKDFRTAETLLNRAIKSDPDHPESYGNLGSIMELDGRLEAAAEAYSRVRSLKPESPFGHVRFADTCQKMERYGEALEAYEQGLKIDPQDASAWSGLSRVSMFEGNWEKGLDAADRALSKDPGNSLLLAIKSVAYSELDRKDETAELVDFEKLIDVQHFSAPDGYADMSSFNDALREHCLAHPTLAYEPDGKSTMKGHQTDDISQDGEGTPISPLRDCIVDAVRGYQESHPIDSSHPFLAQRPARWGAYIWATVLESSGHQASHIHPSGWLSGVYYVKLPDVISANSDDKAGWIEFGEAAKYPHAKAENDVRFYQPEEGMVVLFPSYFYHRTVPFESDDQRISIAFDIVPVEQED